MKRSVVAIVGSGPYGLSVAAHLRARNVPFRIFGRPMNTWRQHMPAGMFLKSEGFASNLSDPGDRLTLRRFCHDSGRPYGDYGYPVPLETFTAYGAWFQDQAALDVEEADVASVEPDGARGFVVELEFGERFTARRVVVATGVVPFAHTPLELQGVPQRLVTHTSEHASLLALRGRRVAVVGAGQSALETAVLLHEQGAFPHIVARTQSLAWNPAPLPLQRPLRLRLREPLAPLGSGWKFRAYAALMPTYRWLPKEKRVRIARRALGPAGAWWLRERLSADVPLLVGQTLVDAAEHNGGVCLTLEDAAGRRRLDVEHVIAGTGYRTDVDRLGFLAAELRARLRRVRDAPVLSAHFESSVPGLYFVGLPAANTFGPAMRFVCGAAFAAPRVAAHASA